MKNRYVLLDNPYFLDCYCRHYSREYVPIAINDELKALLEARGMKPIGILDYIGHGELKEIIDRAFSAADRLMAALDAENRANYKRIFGTGDIRLIQATISYLFKRFVVGSLKLVRGMDAILEKHDIGELAYLHDGQEILICGTRKMRGFLFPDDVTLDILESWRSDRKPKIRLMKVPGRSRRYPMKKNFRMLYMDRLLGVKTFLYPIKRMLTEKKEKEPDYSPRRKALLFLSPLCELKGIANSANLNKMYNILTWDADDRFDVRGGAPPCRMSFAAPSFSGDIIPEMDFKKLNLPLIERFYEKKLPEILYYWKAAEYLCTSNDIAMVFWGNPPHRCPSGVLMEYFRLKGIPVTGMQHGGLYGSNDMGKTFLETELGHSDYYFSYGFREEDICGERRPVMPSVIPVGSAAIKSFYSEYNGGPAPDKEKVDIIFPTFLSTGGFYYEYELYNPRLFDLQKKVVDLMAGFGGRKILLKFPCGASFNNPLRIYVESRYPGRFIVIDHLSFSDCLKRFDPGAIVIEEQSTPLNEALATKANIIVFNNKELAGLAPCALQMLSKRAVVCSDEEVFLKAVRDCLNGSIEGREMDNTEFLRKYCLYRGDPCENMENAVLSILGEAGSSRPAGITEGCAVS